MLRRNIILMALIIAPLTLQASIPKRYYEVLAGEMNITLGGAVGFSIDKSKILIRAEDYKDQIIPINIRSYSKKNIQISIMRRSPDFLTDGYIPLTDQAQISILPMEVVFTLSPFKKYQYDMTIRYDNTKKIVPTEAWVGFLGNDGQLVIRELVLRLLISN